MLTRSKKPESISSSSLSNDRVKKSKRSRPKRPSKASAKSVPKLIENGSLLIETNQLIESIEIEPIEIEPNPQICAQCTKEMETEFCSPKHLASLVFFDERCSYCGKRFYKPLPNEEAYNKPPLFCFEKIEFNKV